MQSPISKPLKSLVFLDTFVSFQPLGSQISTKMHSTLVKRPKFQTSRSRSRIFRPHRRISRASSSKSTCNNPIQLDTHKVNPTSSFLSPAQQAKLHRPFFLSIFTPTKVILNQFPAHKVSFMTFQGIATIKPNFNNCTMQLAPGLFSYQLKQDIDETIVSPHISDAQQQKSQLQINNQRPFHPQILFPNTAPESLLNSKTDTQSPDGLVFIDPWTAGLTTTQEIAHSFKNDFITEEEAPSDTENDQLLPSSPESNNKNNNPGAVSFQWFTSGGFAVKKREHVILSLVDCVSTEHLDPTKIDQFVHSAQHLSHQVMDRFWNQSNNQHQPLDQQQQQKDDPSPPTNPGPDFDYALRHPDAYTVSIGSDVAKALSTLQNKKSDKQ